MRSGDPSEHNGATLRITDWSSLLNIQLRAMNPRRVHKLMKEHFPPVDAVAHTWINLLERGGTMRTEALAALIDAHNGASELVIEVHRKLGDFLDKANAIKFIGEHIGQGQIRITDRSFQGFVVVAVNGAATGWSLALNSSLHTDSQASL
jgi:hypothetical protein